MEINDKKVKFRMIQSSILLNTFEKNDPIDFREDDGRFHSGYRLLSKKDDNSEFVIARPDGTRFTLMWWKMIDLKNKNGIRTSWNFNDPYPVPEKYEFTVEELEMITEFFRRESKKQVG